MSLRNLNALLVWGDGHKKLENYKFSLVTKRLELTFLCVQYLRCIGMAQTHVHHAIHFQSLQTHKLPSMIVCIYLFDLSLM